MAAFQTSDSAPGEFHDHVSDGEEVGEEDERMVNIEEIEGNLLRDVRPAGGGGRENTELLSNLGQRQYNNPDTAKLLDL